MYTTKALTRTFGITADTLRYYEKLGLLQKAERKPNGYRLYQPDTPRRLHFIQQCQAVGFKLQEIKRLLEIEADPSADCTDISDFINAKLKELQEKIQHLKDIEKILSLLVEQCEGPGVPPSKCTILKTFYDEKLILEKEKALID